MLQIQNLLPPPIQKTRLEKHKKTRDKVFECFRTVMPRNSCVWASKNRVLGAGTARQGKFDPELTPYIIPISESIKKNEYVRYIVYMGTQMCKTELAFNTLGQRYDDDPVPALYIAPTQKLIESISNDRFKKMLRSTASLWGKLAKGKRDKTNEKFISGVRLGFTWASSAIELSSHAVCIIIVDEVDKMGINVKRQGNPIELADARIDTFPDGYLLIVSSPGIIGASAILFLYVEGTQFIWQWPCPHCLEYFAPTLELFRYPDKEERKENKKWKAWLECPHCQGRIFEKHRKWCNTRGKYVGPNQRIENCEVVGEIEVNIFGSWSVSGLCSPFRNWTRVAKKYIKALASGDEHRLQVIVNTAFGEGYKVEGEAPDRSELEAVKGKYCRGQVNPEAMVLLCTVDVQKRGLYWLVRAHGENQQSWLVDYGYLAGDTLEDKVWEDLEETILKGGYGKDKAELSGMFVDCRYREERVFKFCHLHRGKVFACRGQYSQVSPVRIVRVEIDYDGKPLKGGITVINLNDGYFKLWVYTRITRGLEVDDAWQIPLDVCEDYCKQVISEELVTNEHGQEFWVKKYRHNHYLDCEKMQAGASTYLHLRLLNKSAKKVKRQKSRSFSEGFDDY